MRSVRQAFVLGAVLGLIPFGSALADGPSDAFLGTWTGTGTLFGSPSDYTMTWERTLRDRFLRLSFRNSAIEATAFYRVADDPTWTGTWHDSRGVTQPLSATWSDSTLEVAWGSPETEQGRTTYRLVGPDAIDVRDEVLRGEAWSVFGEARYARARPASSTPSAGTRESTR